MKEGDTVIVKYIKHVPEKGYTDLIVFKRSGKKVDFNDFIRCFKEAHLLARRVKLGDKIIVGPINISTALSQKYENKTLYFISTDKIILLNDNSDEFDVVDTVVDNVDDFPF